jgi:hypothetical protein
MEVASLAGGQAGENEGHWPRRITSCHLQHRISLLHFNDVYNIDAREQEPCGGAARFVTKVTTVDILSAPCCPEHSAGTHATTPPRFPSPRSAAS